MTDAPVALAVPPRVPAADRLAAALSGGGARARPMPPGEAADRAGWLLFDTPGGEGALRLDVVDGLARPPADEADGPGAALALERAEPLVADIERALGLAVEPRGIGPVPDGVAVVVERAPHVLRLVLPEALADALPAPGPTPGEIAGTRACAVEVAVPPLPGDAALGAGDLVLLGPCPAASVTPPGGVGIETRLVAEGLSAGGRRPALAAPPGDAVLALRADLTAADRRALADGAPLALAEGAAPPARLALGARTVSGHLIPFAGQVALRLDPTP